MSHEEVGFLLGALPGLALAIRNIWQARALQKRIEAVAWKDHDWQNTQTSRGEMARAIKSPEGYIGSTDSPELVQAKRELLETLPNLQRRQWLVLAVFLVGSALGSIAASVIG